MLIGYSVDKVLTEYFRRNETHGNFFLIQRLAAYL